jgi:hypothetical protein
MTNAGAGTATRSPRPRYHPAAQPLPKTPAKHKGTDLSRWDAREITAVAATLNARPRKSLDWRTPAEVFNELLQSAQKQAGVATTD